MPVMNVGMYVTSNEEAEGRAAAHALPEHLLQGPGLLLLMEPLLEVRGLRTHFRTDRGLFRAVDGIDFTVGRGQTVGLVGESGCGKSVTSLSVMGLVASPPGTVEGDAIRFEGRDLLGLSADERRKLRGGKMSMIFQEPMTSLNPVFTIGQQIVEAHPRPHPALAAGGQGARDRDARAGAHPLGRGALRRLPAPPVGRHAPARDDRHGAVVRAGAADRRRADHRARRHHPGADPRAAADLQQAARHGDADHHPRSRRGRRDRRRRGGDVRRPDRRERAGRRAVRRSAASLHDRPAGLDPAPRRRPRAALDHRGHGARRRPPAPGCRFSPRCPFADRRCRAEPPPLRDIGAGPSGSPAGRRRWSSRHERARPSQVPSCRSTAW